LAWKIEITRTAENQLKGLDKTASKRITDYLRNRVAMRDDPRDLGTALTGDFKGCWRYRVGDYRIICSLEDQELIVLVLEIGHRREVYR
jgi:mRNA interferase RelE/StbE